MSYSAPTYNEAETSFQQGATERRHFRPGAITTDQWGTRTYRYCRVKDRTLYGHMVGTPLAGVISSGYALNNSVYVKNIGPWFGANA